MQTNEKLMTKYAIPSSRMRAIDANCEYLGLMGRQLMENAGASLAQEVVQHGGKKVVIIAGRGNNGGDAFVAARHLASKEDIDVKVALAGRSSQIRTEDARQNFKLLEHSGITAILEIMDGQELEASGWLENVDIIIDAILGTGVKGHIREPESTLIDLINNSDAHVIAVDIPSGVDPDGGSFEKAVHADVTLTFHRMKIGLVEKYAGVIRVVDIGVCQDAEDFVGMGDLHVLTRRRPDSHKGQAGRVLVIGGGAYSGAPALAALAALRCGADIVTIAAPDNVASTIASFSPNLIVRHLSSNHLCPDDVELISDLIQTHDVVVIGMGLGRDMDTVEAISGILPMCTRVVVDADALHKLKLPPAEGCEMIITPHAGEFEALRGRRTPYDLEARAEAALAFSTEKNVITLLKGRYDTICDSRRVAFNRTGNPGMTVGGTGDVLAGIVAAIFATSSAMDAACCGAFINGMAGDLALKERGYGLLATDVIDRITEVMER
ncbi:MAG: NAD(P)H-hydrate dehydratase [Euryarchaeota archaeon]|nr:NAD(P)H-hydrate dehydratase [Euryarchaeota archaeon]